MGRGWGSGVAFQWEESCGLPGYTHKLDSRHAVKVGQLSVCVAFCPFMAACSVLWCPCALLYGVQAGKCY